MRIIAGDFKGRVIESPSGAITRPTTDRVRESVFSSVYSRLDDLDDVEVLDAFAGSGALGIEALSRGAKCCVFIEQDASARKVLEGNLTSLGLKPPRVSIMSGNAFEVVKRLSCDAQDGFGLILLDPPYALSCDQVYSLLICLAQDKRMTQGAVVVYEHALKDREAVAAKFEQDTRFAVTGQKKYGKIGVTYLEYQDHEEEHA